MPQNLMQGAVIHEVHALKWGRGESRKKISRIFLNRYSLLFKIVHGGWEGRSVLGVGTLWMTLCIVGCITCDTPKIKLK